MNLTTDPLICTHKACGKALSAWVPFCPYCGTVQPKPVMEKPAEAKSVESKSAVPDIGSTPSLVDKQPVAAVVPDSSFADSAALASKSSPFSDAGGDTDTDGSVQKPVMSSTDVPDKAGQASPFEIKGVPEAVDSSFGDTPKSARVEQEPKGDSPAPDDAKGDSKNVTLAGDKPLDPPERPNPDVGAGGAAESGGKPKSGGAKFVWLVIIAVLGIGGYLFFARQGLDETDRLVAEAQVAYDRRDLVNADKILLEVLRKKPDHPAARKLNAEIQAKYALHRKLLAEARVNLLRNRFADARSSADTVLSEDPTNSDAQDIKRRAESGMQAIVARCDAAAQSGVDFALNGNLDMARRKLQEARASGTDCDGVQRLAQEIAGAEQRMPAVVRQAPQPAVQDNTAILRKQLAEARQQLVEGNHTTALKLAQSAKEMAASDNVRFEADQIISAANKMKTEQANRRDIFR